MNLIARKGKQEGLEGGKGMMRRCNYTIKEKKYRKKQLKEKIRTIDGPDQGITTGFKDDDS